MTMIKALMVSTTLMAGTLSLAPVVMAQTSPAAQSASPRDQLYANDRFVDSHYVSGKTGVTADGRCGGVSYGTGQRDCGTATGGPVGGNANRN
jgi:hypothetical protein